MRKFKPSEGTINKITRALERGSKTFGELLALTHMSSSLTKKHMSSSTLSAALEKMDRDGLLKREVAAREKRKGRRAILISLSEKAKSPVEVTLRHLKSVCPRLSIAHGRELLTYDVAEVVLKIASLFWAPRAYAGPSLPSPKTEAEALDQLVKRSGHSRGEFLSRDFEHDSIYQRTVGYVPDEMGEPKMKLNELLLIIALARFYFECSIQDYIAKRRWTDEHDGIGEYSGRDIVDDPADDFEGFVVNWAKKFSEPPADFLNRFLVRHEGHENCFPALAVARDFKVDQKLEALFEWVFERKCKKEIAEVVPEGLEMNFITLTFLWARESYINNEIIPAWEYALEKELPLKKRRNFKKERRNFEPARG